jgi:hypothetical protein
LICSKLPWTAEAKPPLSFFARRNVEQGKKAAALPPQSKVITGIPQQNTGEIHRNGFAFRHSIRLR